MKKEEKKHTKNDVNKDGKKSFYPKKKDSKKR